MLCSPLVLSMSPMSGRIPPGDCCACGIRLESCIGVPAPNDGMEVSAPLSLSRRQGESSPPSEGGPPMEGGPPPDAPPAAAPNPPDAFNALTSSELPGEFFRPGRDGMCTSGKALRFFASRAGEADSPSEPRAAAAFASACDCAERSEDDVGGA